MPDQITDPLELKHMVRDDQNGLVDDIYEADWEEQLGLELDPADQAKFCRAFGLFQKVLCTVRLG